MGRQRAGKDFTYGVISELDESFVRVALADTMRAALYALNPAVQWGGSTPDSNRLQTVVNLWGWDKAKETLPEVRYLLQRFGTEVGRNFFGQDFWIEQAKIDPTANTVITDVRFANEIQWVRDHGGVLWRINRTDLPPENMADPKYQHASEKDWRTADVDRELINNGPDFPLSYPFEVRLALDSVGVHTFVNA